MKFNGLLSKLICVFVAVALVSQVTGCGLILYPERKGQTQGSIDPGVAVLDAIGLLFFIIPGVIAFAVDFSTGTIYYPSGKNPKKLSLEKVAIIHVNPADLKDQNICDLVKSNAGCAESFTMSDAKVFALNGPEDIRKRLEEAVSSKYSVN